MAVFKDSETKPLDMTAVRELNDTELATELEDLQRAQFNKRFSSSTEDIYQDNRLQIRITRRNVARLKTVLRERKNAQ